MKRFSTFSSSLLVIGAIGLLVSSLFSAEEIFLDLSDEDIHMYL